MVLLGGCFMLTTNLNAEDIAALNDCQSCHTEQASEFEASVHYINRSGVQAGCNNCHAGKQHADGANTTKQIDKTRMDMAVSEWKRMISNNSKECNSCHSHMAMDLAKQEPLSVDSHEKSFDAGKTSCVECHQGISHYLPPGWKNIAKKLIKKK